MILWISIAWLIVGGILLWKGADWLVDGASDIAGRFRIPPIYIGLTIVAFGTSLPELVVSLYAVLTGKPGISIGNIVGSNIANIGLIIGITALIYPLVVKKKTITYEFPIMVILTFLFPLLANKNYIWNKDEFYISRFTSIIFLLCFLIFLYYIFQSVKANKKKAEKELSAVLPNSGPLWKSILFTVLGPIILYYGGNLFVDSSSDIARFFGVSELLIGLTIVSIGTSLPELFTTIAAVAKKNTDIAVGNIVGSNIFNIGWVLGLVGLIKKLPFDSSLVYIDSMVMIAFTLVFWLFAAKSKKILRSYGAILLIGYITYISYLIFSSI